jgi:hypothetical protein
LEIFIIRKDEGAKSDRGVEFQLRSFGLFFQKSKVATSLAAAAAAEEEESFRFYHNPIFNKNY